MQGKVFYKDEDVWQSKCVTVKRTIENFEVRKYSTFTNT